MIDDRLMIVDLSTGNLRPAVDRQPVLSSSSQGWEGFLLEQHAAGPVDNYNIAPTSHTICLQLEGRTTIEVLNGSEHPTAVSMSPGQASIFPASVPVTLRTRDTGGFLALTLDPRFVACATHEIAGPGQLCFSTQLGIADPLIVGVLLALKIEAEISSPKGPLYAETLASCLAIHMARHYGSNRAEVQNPGHSPARNQIRRAIEHIHEHLAEDLSLASLAQVASLSPYHFARLFKRSTGLAPHQYLVRCRVEKGRQILVNSRTSVAEVAAQTGFCDQSHFAAHFKRIYGLAPKTFLQQAPCA
jgi:AraC family transcriptional regulator